MQADGKNAIDNTRRSLVGSGAALAAGSLLPTRLVRAQSLQKVTISYPTRSGASWPMYIAKEAGIYAKYGLDVNLVFGVHPAGIAMLNICCARFWSNASPRCISFHRCCPRFCP